MKRLAWLVLAAAAALVAVPTTLAEDFAPTWRTFSADAPLGGPTIFRGTMFADKAPALVEALISTPGDKEVTVVVADVLPNGSGTFDVEATLEGHVLPNTRLAYRFRVTYPSGVSYESDSSAVVVVDDRVEWRTLHGPIVQLHWYTGDDAFAQRALDIGEQAVANAGQLLDVTEKLPIDFYIYADDAFFREALGPGTRENVAGRAVNNIRTMFGLIRPREVNDTWVDVLVTHELTHLVFDTATDNVYRPAPHWLNEGIAVYLSEGNTARWQSSLELGISDGAIIPLQGMANTFGAGDLRFELGYAESVSAVEYFVNTYGEPKLWELVRSYAAGVSDDDAFTSATGLDLAGFNNAWMQSVQVTVPAELGPRPGPTGPLPPDWLGLPPATPGPVVTPGPPRAAPGSPNRPAPPGGGTASGAFAVVVWLITVVSVLAAVWYVKRRNRRPPRPPWYGAGAPPTWAATDPTLPPWAGGDAPPPLWAARKDDPPPPPWAAPRDDPPSRPPDG